MSDRIDRLNVALEGRYRIEGRIGEGGMATVYLAEDLRHERRVALKLLRPELAALVGADRFLTEIKTTANLQHPHILPLHDSGVADGFLFYVMPYIEGESLRERLDREKQLPVAEAVAIAKRVAGALGAAHDRGVVHRDIKPANILLGDGGEPLVADFGIALAVQEAGGGRLTETGLSLGTPHYMSPEQAAGDRTLDKRSDIYALGCVLHEMLAGQPPHGGPTAQAVLARILTDEPRRVMELRPTVPPQVDGAVAKALEKLPADRFASAGEFVAALSDPGFRHGGAGAAVDAGAARRWRRTAAGLAVLTAALVVGLAAVLTRPDAALPVQWVHERLAPGDQGEATYLGGFDYWNRFGRPALSEIAFSPDGTSIVYRAGTVNGPPRLYLGLTRQDPEPLPGTEGAYQPFFSPAGDWVAFLDYDDESLQRIRLADYRIETVVRFADIPNVRVTGAAWGDDDRIVMSTDRDMLLRIPAGGGRIDTLAMPPPVADEVPLEAGSRAYGAPSVLPGSEAILLHERVAGPGAGYRVVALEPSTGARTVVLGDAADPRFVRTGHLLFLREGRLMAIGFDPDRLAVRGEAVELLDNVAQSIDMPNSGWELGVGQLALSSAGHLAYARGGIYPWWDMTPVRITAQGDTVRLEVDVPRPRQLRASHDGSRMAFSAGPSGRRRIWIHDLTRGVTRPLDTGLPHSFHPAWGPDDRWLAFAGRSGPEAQNVYRIRADGEGGAERLAPSERQQVMFDWSSKGAIAYGQDDDIWVLPPGGDPAPFVASADGEWHATFSPDGNWLAYTVVDSLNPFPRIEVRAYPGPGAPTVITDRGESPAWSPEGNIYYRSQPDSVLMAVDVTPGSPFRASRPTPFISPWPSRAAPVRRYDVLPDGSLLTIAEDPGSVLEQLGIGQIEISFNFVEWLRERMDGGG